VGTERSLFDLALVNPNLCEGLVVIDTNISVKAYIDFVVLLLRISKNREDFVRLSTIDPSGTLSYEELCVNKINEIRAVTLESDLPPDIKQYYLKNLDAFGHLYFKVRGNDGSWDGSGGDWRRNEERFLHYYKDDDLFKQLERYAKSGNIIAVVGNAQDLQFLNGRNIEILDISNVPDYSILKLNTESNPRIISTRVDESLSSYHSCIYGPMTRQNIEEVDGLLPIYSSLRSKEWPGAPGILVGAVPRDIPWCYSVPLLDSLRKYKEQYLVKLDGRWFDCKGTHLSCWMYDFPQSEIKDLPSRCEHIPILVKNLVENWRMRSDIYLRFSEVPGWKEAFRAKKALGDPEFMEKFGDITV
jgi:hypothetical protein